MLASRLSRAKDRVLTPRVLQIPVRTYFHQVLTDTIRTPGFSVTSPTWMLFFNSYLSLQMKSTIPYEICPQPLPMRMRTKKSRVHCIIMHNDTGHRLSDECVKHIT